MNEAETRAEHIDSVMKAAGWGVVEGSRVLREHGITLESRTTRAAHAKALAHDKFNDKQQAFVDFVLAQYVAQGVDELDAEKLSPLLKLRYKNALTDAVKDLGSPEQIRGVFVGFQQYLYQNPRD